MVETERLYFHRTKQSKLRCDTYSNIRQSVVEGNTDPTLLGKPVMLSSSFTGRPRYMKQNYMDAMALCIWYGCPDLFITITCNPNWPEIARYMEAHNLSATDRPDVMSRVFKMKLDQLMKDLKDLRLFGRTQAVVYTVEFQKRGLPHAHICLFLHKDDKVPSVDQIDKYISAEIPDKNEDPDLYKLVSDFMMHGPCGEDDPTQVCMAEGKCTKHFPKKFTERSSVDSEDIYLRVRRRGGYLDLRLIIEHRLLTKFILLHLSADHVLYDRTLTLKAVMHKPSVWLQVRSKGWMKMIELIPKARELAYASPDKVYLEWRQERIRWIRKQGKNSLWTQVISVPISTEYAYYCRCC
ncbi:hypothetical protein Tco_0080256 [Tanacetum coccineum]